MWTVCRIGLLKLADLFVLTDRSRLCAGNGFHLLFSYPISSPISDHTTHNTKLNTHFPSYPHSSILIKRYWKFGLTAMEISIAPTKLFPVYSVLLPQSLNSRTDVISNEWRVLDASGRNHDQNLHILKRHNDLRISPTLITRAPTSLPPFNS